MASRSLARECSLPQILSRAIVDTRLRMSLFNHPDQAIEEYKLAAVEREILRHLSPDRFDAIVGRMIAHKLLPQRIGRRFVVIPTWSEASIHADAIPIRINQRQTGVSISADVKVKTQCLAFGSGVHPSTSLCLRTSEEHLESGMVFLDLGTGTGILVIAATKLGARHVIALDIDGHALQTARENLAANGIEDVVKLGLGSLAAVLHDRNPRFHLVVANIVASVHQASIRMALMDLLYPKGKIIFSGMIEPETMSIETALVKAGCQPIGPMQQRQWIALIV